MINSNIALKHATIVIFCGALGLAQNNHFDYTCPYKASQDVGQATLPTVA